MDVIVALNGYDDIFDDFDPQAYVERAISADFMDALGKRMANLNRKERVNIMLTLPYYRRVIKDEKVIKERLAEHFWNMARHWEERESEARDQSVAMMAIGLLVFSIGQFLIHEYFSFFDELIIIPAWFLTFYGLDKYLFDVPKNTSKKGFFESLKGAKVTFRDEGAAVNPV
jgi:hypothetical protein